MVYYGPQFFFKKIQNLKTFKIFLGAHLFVHTVFTLRKIFNKVFDIMYLTFVNRHNSAKL